jgi:hypothetical protein
VARQRTLKLLGPVGGEDEQDIGILLQPVHFVEQRVKQRLLARPHVLAIAGDEIDILNHHHRRLQQARQAHVVDLRCLMINVV